MQRRRRIGLILPLNYICLQRPKNTGGVPRSAWSSVERERVGGERKRGMDKRGRERERSRTIGEESKRGAKPFSISLSLIHI